jgi:hypothetical protein
MTQVVRQTEPERQIMKLTIFIYHVRFGSNIMTVPRQCVRPFLRKPLYRNSNNTGSNEIVHLSSRSAGVLGDKSSSASSSSRQEAAAPPHHEQERTTIRRLERHLTLTDLIAIGIGATIGSG